MLAVKAQKCLLNNFIQKCKAKDINEEKKRTNKIQMHQKQTDYSWIMWHIDG